VIDFHTIILHLRLLAQALDWKDSIVSLLHHADDVRLLLCRGQVRSVESLARRLVFPDLLTRPIVCRHQLYLLSFLRACPPLVLQQFIARAMSSYGDERCITVVVSDEVSHVTFERASCLVRVYR